MGVNGPQEVDELHVRCGRNAVPSGVEPEGKGQGRVRAVLVGVDGTLEFPEHAAEED